MTSSNRTKEEVLKEISRLLHHPERLRPQHYKDLVLLRERLEKK